METLTLAASTRTVRGRKNYAARAAGQVPAVFYGVGTEPRMIALDRKVLLQTFRQAGESALVDLVIDAAAPVKVLIQDLQYDPLYHELIHADFRSVDLTKLVTAEIKLHFVGEAPAVKALGGTLIYAHDAVEVEALPQALVPSIEVDISGLKTFENVIHLSDIPFPPGVTPKEPPETTIVVVAPPRSEEEMAALDKAVELDVNAVEVAKKEKKEGEAEAATDEKEKK
ncbi:50S ribosomal protein L25 [Candidatus Uhrbacteria bacterium]|nr:50S ribosomal protein L25 [Candidatus Uhrbacteria bacterium]